MQCYRLVPWSRRAAPHVDACVGMCIMQWTITGKGSPPPPQGRVWRPATMQVEGATPSSTSGDELTGNVHHGAHERRMLSNPLRMTKYCPVLRTCLRNWKRYESKGNPGGSSSHHKGRSISIHL